jgi:aspartate-semialdehyde dehydrogenase
MHIAIVGATGAVGEEMLRLLEENRNIFSLTPFASDRSQGKNITFQGKEIPLRTLNLGCFRGIDAALFSAGKKISIEWSEQVKKEGAVMIDNSSAFRHNAHVPLIIPEINSHSLKNHQGIISCPNCITTLLLLVLAPLHKAAKLKRITLSSYQAASGAGKIAMHELKEETRAHLEDKTFLRTAIPHPYAFNLFTHNSPLLENGYVEEEMKIVHETHKILEDDTIAITATCVRVPVFRAHSIAVNAEFDQPIDAKKAYAILEKASGIIREENATPLNASGQRKVHYGRIRDDLFQPNTLNLWIVGDQLLKGAALNAIQILEFL